MNLIRGVLSERTAALVRFDLQRLRARLRWRFRKKRRPDIRKLHFGSGSRRIDGWLNADVTASDSNVDLAAGVLPWVDDAFEVALGQHVVEHLDLTGELIPLLRELHRVLVAGGELWLSCPDVAKICRSYVDHQMADLIADREERSRTLWPDEWTLAKELGIAGVPPTQMINSIFFQAWEHRNLFDLDLLRWVLELAGFVDVERVDETLLLDRFPEVPLRGDDKQSLYVRARKKST